MNSLKQSLNAIREISSTIYHEYIPVIDDSTDISAFATPLFEYPVVYNEFCDVLVNKLVYSQFETMTFNNPLRVLDGDRIPLGYAGEHVYTNPAKARGFNVNDFAGLLVKYESDTKVEYHAVNSDIQYCVTISRQQLKKAMTSWDNLANREHAIIYHFVVIHEQIPCELLVIEVTKSEIRQIVAFLHDMLSELLLRIPKTMKALLDVIERFLTAEITVIGLEDFLVILIHFCELNNLVEFKFIQATFRIVISKEILIILIHKFGILLVNVQ